MISDHSLNCSLFISDMSTQFSVLTHYYICLFFSDLIKYQEKESSLALHVTLNETDTHACIIAGIITHKPLTSLTSHSWGHYLKFY